MSNHKYVSVRICDICRQRKGVAGCKYPPSQGTFQSPVGTSEDTRWECVIACRLTKGGGPILYEWSPLPDECTYYVEQLMEMQGNGSPLESL